MRITDWFLVIPWHRAGHRAGVDPGPVARHHHLRHRGHVVGQHRAHRPSQVLSVRERSYVERARALGAERLARDHAARAAQRLPGDLRQHDPDRRDRDPVGDHALVPGPRRSPAHLVGDDHRERVRRGRHQRRVVVARLPRLASCSSSWRSRCVGTRWTTSSTPASASDDGRPVGSRSPRRVHDAWPARCPRSAAWTSRSSGAR